MPDDRPDAPAAKRRRRAVGPVGAPPAVAPGELGLAAARDADERPPADDDERLRRDVPPHHGA